MEGRSLAELLAPKMLAPVLLDVASSVRMLVFEFFRAGLDTRLKRFS